MIDTIVIILRKIDTHVDWDIYQIADRLDIGTVKTITSSDSIFLTGKLKNLKVQINEYCLKVTGSLTKYYFDNNLQTMDYDDIVAAIDCLSDELKLPIERGYIKRLDIGRNIVVKKIVKQYLDCYDESDGYYRDRNNTRLLYKKTNGTHSVTIYDKIKELKKNEREFYQYNRNGVLHGKHILRYEVKLEQKINKLLKYKSIRVVHLRSETFLNKLNDFWYMRYKSISTKKTFDFSADIASYGALERELLVKAIHDMGVANIFKYLEHLRQSGKITANQKAYGKKKIKELIANTSSLIELDPTVELMSGIEFLHQNVNSDEFIHLKGLITKSEAKKTKSISQIQRKKF
ncbi:MAG: hypothetical protein JST86_09230 [Bacteroidetes bacterium]|nr:hypothetical protein [Bacteroidota bacterium]